MSLPSTAKYIRFEIIDMNGKSLSRIVPARHKHEVCVIYAGLLGVGAHPSVLYTPPEEIGARGCPNSELIPRWETLTVLPWAQVGSAETPTDVARVYCELSEVPPGHTASEVPRDPGLLNPSCPRYLARRQLSELRSRFGLELRSAQELEFTILGTDGKPLHV